MTLVKVIVANSKIIGYIYEDNGKYFISRSTSYDLSNESYYTEYEAESALKNIYNKEKYEGLTEQYENCQTKIVKQNTDNDIDKAYYREYILTVVTELLKNVYSEFENKPNHQDDIVCYFSFRKLTDPIANLIRNIGQKYTEQLIEETIKNYKYPEIFGNISKEAIKKFILLVAIQHNFVTFEDQILQREIYMKDGMAYSR